MKNLTDRRELYDYAERTDGKPVYIGKSHPEALTSEKHWQIRKITYDNLNNPIEVSFAGLSNAYDKIWNKRDEYIYVTTSRKNK